MKRGIKLAAAALAVMMLLSSTAFAAADTGTNAADNGTTLALQDSKLTVTCKNAAIQKDGQYLLMVVRATNTSAEDQAEWGYTISQSNILYIWQETASSAGTVTFQNVYPSRLTNSVVLLSGTGLSQPIVVGWITVSYTPGDVDGNGAVTAYDAYRVALLLAGSIKESDLPVAEAADVNESGDITASDMTIILQYLVGSVDTLPVTKNAN